MSGYVLHPEAYNDLDGIWEFIAEDNLDAADRVREEIYEAIRKLLPFPYQGHRRPDLTSRPLRFIAVYEYPIAFAPDENPLLVLAVLHGRRNPKVIASILRSRKT
jgi:plasmid stabilization system protein ParE